MATELLTQRPTRRPVHAISAVHGPYDTVTAVLVDRPAAAFTAGPASAPPVVVELGGPANLSRAVRLGWGHWFIDSDNAFTLPVWWEASEHQGLFPTFDGGLELRPAGPEKTEIHLVGSYVPPLGRAGRFADQMVGHRVVCDSVEGFLADITRRLGAAARTLPA